MFKKFDNDIDIAVAEDFYDYYELAKLDDQGKELLLSAVEIEDAPQAPTQKEVKENCQGWVLRVVERLVNAGVVERRWVSSLTQMMERVDWNRQTILSPQFS
jgi:hypothetical protein